MYVDKNRKIKSFVHSFLLAAIFFVIFPVCFNKMRDLSPCQPDKNTERERAKKNNFVSNVQSNGTKKGVVSYIYGGYDLC